MGLDTALLLLSAGSVPIRERRQSRLNALAGAIEAKGPEILWRFVRTMAGSSWHNAVPRPSAATKVKYNEVSSKFWNGVHRTLSGQGTAAENLEMLEVELTELEGSGW